MHVGVAPTLDAYDPPPPPDHRYLAVLGAKIPTKTRDGRTWGDLGTMPDPYLKIYVNGSEVLRTVPQARTVNPTWPDALRGNVALKDGDEFSMEVWDDGSFGDRPIGAKALTFTSESMSGDDTEIDLDGGVEIHLTLLPAIPAWGVGLSYEMRGAVATISKVMDASPGSRAGVRMGDQLLRIGGRGVSKMTGAEVERLLQHVPADGIKATLVHKDGSTLEATLKEGPIYTNITDGDPRKPAK